MNRRPVSLLAAMAAIAAFGGFHLEIASGRALEGPSAPNDARLQTGSALAYAVNRSDKRDRLGVSTPAAGHTIIFAHPELPSTTVAVQLRETTGAATRRAPARPDRAPKPKQAVACEPVVSALTEVAKHLEAGRCVT